MTSFLAPARRSLVVRLAPALLALALPTTGCGTLVDIALTPSSPDPEYVVVEEERPCPETVVIVEERESCERHEGREHEHREHEGREHEHQEHERREREHSTRPAPARALASSNLSWNPSPPRAPSNPRNQNVSDNRDRKHR